MAIDTPQKRHSAMNHGCPWRGNLSVPSGTIGNPARQAATYMYSGIAAEENNGPMLYSYWRKFRGLPLDLWNDNRRL